MHSGRRYGADLRSGDDAAARLPQDLHAAHLADRSGEVATYIPELAEVDPELFGICIVMVDGTVYEVGDSHHRFTIQSMSKPLTYAMALDELGADVVGARIGLEPTGDAFNAISLDPVTGQATNAMVNAGAITAADLLHARHGDRALDHLLDGYSKFAGRPLARRPAGRRVRTGDRPSQSSDRPSPPRCRIDGRRRRDIAAALLRPVLGRGRLPRPRRDRRDARQRWPQPDRRRRGGHPADRPPRAGRHGELRDVRRRRVDGSCRSGLPAKSGVSGGIIAVLPGQLGVAVFSPRLDSQGNSVRGVNVCRELAGTLGLHLVTSGRRGANRAPTLRTLADGGSRRKRSPEAIEQLGAMGDEVLAIVLRGDIQFADAEYAVRSLVDAQAAAARPARFVIVDLARTGIIHEALPRLLRTDRRRTRRPRRHARHRRHRRRFQSRRPPPVLRNGRRRSTFLTP